MPLRLLSPRETGRKFYYVRGILCGKRHFASTGTAKRSDAEKYREEFEKQIKAEYSGKSSRMTFAAASMRYMAWKKPSARNEGFINDVVDEIGLRYVDEITQDDIVMTANALYGGKEASTKNRAVIRPTAAILHYAAKNKWCEWLRIDTFKEKAVKTRYVSQHVEKALHDTLRLEGTAQRVQKRLFLLWLFRQGDRVSDTVNIRYEDIDFGRMVISRHISKSDRFVELPLDETIGRYLRKQNITTGKVFIWQTQYGAQQWINKLAKKAKVEFSAHMARHTLGKRLNDSGAGLKTIMQVLGQTDPKSAIRYQTTDIETIRLAKKKVK